jgi:Domain of unknown function (DUF4115)
VLIGGIVAIAVVLGVIGAAVVRTRSRDEVHSVEHYHRSLHTLEEMRTHSPQRDQNGAHGNGDATYPVSTFRVSGSSTVRLTEPGAPIVPPAPPPVPTTAEPLRFDDEGEDGEEPVPVGSSFMTGSEDRAMHGIDKRPRRLAAPAAALAVVLVLVVVLVVTGFHSNTPAHHGQPGSGASTGSTTVTQPHHATGAHHATTHPTVPTTIPPAVSPPAVTNAHAATYTVSASGYSLVVAATNGECWVQATNTSSGAVLFSGTLYPGQSHTLAVSGPLTVIAGAPGAFAATVDGSAVTLPAGFQAPFTLSFQASTGGATT